MKWFEREGRCVAAVAPSLVAAVAASLPAPTGYTAAPARAAVAAVTPASATAQTISPPRAPAAPAAVAPSGAALSVVGQLLIGDESCSAAVVGSSSGRLAVTAAHSVCVPAATERMPDVAEGASGGPWAVPDRGWWSVVAVTSYLSWELPGMLGGVRLGAVAERLWRAADEVAGRR